jgi:hypothetical protein
LLGVQEVVGSNPAVPTIFLEKPFVGVVLVLAVRDQMRLPRQQAKPAATVHPDEPKEKPAAKWVADGACFRAETP